MSLPEGVFMDLMNLHDTFLNADLQRECTMKAPRCKDTEEFMVSQRGRFERSGSGWQWPEDGLEG